MSSDSGYDSGPAPSRGKRKSGPGRPSHPIKAHFKAAPHKVNGRAVWHQCKYCDMTISGGRTEVLQGHIFHQCKVIPHEQRQQAALQMPSSFKPGMGGSDLASISRPAVKRSAGSSSSTRALKRAKGQVQSKLPVQQMVEIRCYPRGAGRVFEGAAGCRPGTDD